MLIGFFREVGWKDGIFAHSRRGVAGRGSRGFVAPYRCVDQLDAVLALALRRQREAGYGREQNPGRCCDRASFGKAQAPAASYRATA